MGCEWKREESERSEKAYIVAGSVWLFPKNPRVAPVSALQIQSRHHSQREALNPDEGH